MVDKVKELYPGSKILGVGTSMGANQLLKYAGEQKENSKIEGICALCTPFDITVCSKHLLKSSIVSWLCDQFLVKSMLKVIKENEEFILKTSKQLGIDLNEVYNSKNSIEFDSKYTCKLLGYSNPEEYYNDSSCVSLLDKIRVPTLAISALDDPVVTKDCIPYEKFESNPYLLLAVTKRGGHLGWFQGYRPRRVMNI
jgi:uncharacterized protein